jgi:protein TonB
VRNWHQLLATHLERHKTYPRQAQMLRQQGVVSIRVSLDATGQVLSVALAQSSGSASLDAATLDLARRASPLPPPPSGMETPVSLVIPLRYQLH